MSSLDIPRKLEEVPADVIIVVACWYHLNEESGMYLESTWDSNPLLVADYGHNFTWIFNGSFYFEFNAVLSLLT